MDDLFYQLAQIDKELQGMEHHIDPVEYGELRGQVAALQQQVTDMKLKQAAMDVKLDLVIDKLSEAKGGWRMLMLLGGAGATLGGFIVWAIQNIRIVKG